MTNLTTLSKVATVLEQLNTISSLDGVIFTTLFFLISVEYTRRVCYLTKFTCDLN
ncbi:conserved hypothetical protein [Vibrio chagasii]|nr:conserved hypothetical protein [Vibrio chagasii]CAH6935653.1 conserved hypothetical protein [Vibrio chagasii]CAH7053348.1 conserved hypothetical protein [Vibrio chagasii]CAH7070186.1 conserved hypothetical protein [Vibrio chagasii]CAH7083453.1 conserved hypothetical protein [Vibrio chagasii]